MLNHATARVNESEHERALSEAEHRHTTALYHKAEHDVQRLQRDLKRAIAKSWYVLVDTCTFVNFQLVGSNDLI